MCLDRVNFVADPSLTAQIAATGSFLNLFGGLSTEDLPMVIGYPPSCTEFSCGKRYSGPLDSDAIAAFIADSLLFLPQARLRTLSSMRKVSYQLWLLTITFTRNS